MATLKEHLQGLLETRAAEMLMHPELPITSVGSVAEISIAISLKRLADMMESDNLQEDIDAIAEAGRGSGE